MGENGNKAIKKVTKINTNAFNNMKEKEKEQCMLNQKPTKRIVKEVEEIDEFGNVTKVLLDDEGNIVNEEDIVYEEEEYIDENGNKAIRKVPKINNESFKNMKEKEKCMMKQKSIKRTIKEIEEIDEFGNVRKVLKEIEEEGISKAPGTRNLK